MTEHELQNAIRVYISQNHLGVIFRANVGHAWTGTAHRLGSSLILDDYRAFMTGLPVGFPDLFGFRTVTVTPDMVGKQIAVFCGLEIKTKKGRIRPDQKTMIDYMCGHGARAGIVRSIDDAQCILNGEGGA